MRILDLFSGAGGFSTGFKQAGFEIVTAVDNNVKALQAHELNHPETNHLLMDLKVDEIDEILEAGPYDGVIGGPPCPDFSLANNKKNPGIGMELVNKFFEIIDIVKPKYYIGENVPNSQKYIIKKHHVKNIILNSANYGVPQKRKRLFFGKFKTPPITHDKHHYFNLYKKVLSMLETGSKTLRELMDLSGYRFSAVRNPLTHFMKQGRIKSYCGIVPLKRTKLYVRLY